jgi:hypothetical protein
MLRDIAVPIVKTQALKQPRQFFTDIAKIITSPLRISGVMHAIQLFIITPLKKQLTQVAFTMHLTRYRNI